MTEFDYEHDLPSVEEVHEFMDAINAGREAVGLDRIAKLEYDESEPGSTDNCLSAHHLFCAVPGYEGNVGTSNFMLWGDESEEPMKLLAAALGTPYTDGGMLVRIPSTILRVTDQFDQAEYGDDLWRALRERLVEAGVVDG